VRSYNNIHNNNIVQWSRRRRRCRGESVRVLAAHARQRRRAKRVAYSRERLWRGRRKRPPVRRKIDHRAASPPAFSPCICSCGILRCVSIGETASRERDGTEDIYLYTDSVGPRRSLHEPTRSSDDGKSCSGRRAPDVPVAGH